MNCSKWQVASGKRKAKGKLHLRLIGWQQRTCSGMSEMHCEICVWKSRDTSGKVMKITEYAAGFGARVLWLFEHRPNGPPNWTTDMQHTRCSLSLSPVTVQLAEHFCSPLYRLRLLVPRVFKCSIKRIRWKKMLRQRVDNFSTCVPSASLGLRLYPPSSSPNLLCN